MPPGPYHRISWTSACSQRQFSDKPAQSTHRTGYAVAQCAVHRANPSEVWEWNVRRSLQREGGRRGRLAACRQSRVVRPSRKASRLLEARLAWLRCWWFSAPHHPTSSTCHFPVSGWGPRVGAYRPRRSRYQHVKKVLYFSSHLIVRLCAHSPTESRAYSTYLSDRLVSSHSWILDPRSRCPERHPGLSIHLCTPMAGYQ